MTDINSVVISGRLTADPEVRKTQSGLSVASFTVASNESKEKTNFINCVAWRQSADYLGQFAHKGDLVGVDGHVSTRTYERDGQRVYVTEVVAEKVNILARKAQNVSNEAMPAPAQNRPQTAQNEPTNSWSNGIDINPDDLPF